MRAYVVNGFPKSGKTTFEEMCLDMISPYGYSISTIDFIKTIATTCGWDGTKTPKNRKFLSDLKDLLTTWDDVPYRKVIEKINAIANIVDTFDQDPQNLTFFIDCREPEEIKKFCNRLGARSILVRRQEVENEIQSNHADKNILDYDYDITIVNNGTLKDLYSVAETFIKDEHIYLPINSKKDPINK